MIEPALAHPVKLTTKPFQTKKHLLRCHGSQVLGGSAGGDGPAAACAFLLSFLFFAFRWNLCCILLCLLFEVAKKFPLSFVFQLEYRKNPLKSTPKKDRPLFHISMIPNEQKGIGKRIKFQRGKFKHG